MGTSIAGHAGFSGVSAIGGGDSSFGAAQAIGRGVGAVIGAGAGDGEETRAHPIAITVATTEARAPFFDMSRRCYRWTA